MSERKQLMVLLASDQFPNDFCQFTPVNDASLGTDYYSEWVAVSGMPESSSIDIAAKGGDVYVYDAQSSFSVSDQAETIPESNIVRDGNIQTFITDASGSIKSYGKQFFCLQLP